MFQEIPSTKVGWICRELVSVRNNVDPNGHR